MKHEQRGRPVAYDWHLLEPGKAIFIPGKDAVHMSSTVSKMARKMGAKLKCFTHVYGEGCWVFMEDYDRNSTTVKHHVVAVVVEPDEDPDADIKQYLIDEEDE